MNLVVSYNIPMYIGWKDDVSGIYAIDLVSKDTQLVYWASEDGFISGFF